MRQPHSAIDGQPTGEPVLIFQKQGFHISPNPFALAQGRVASVAGDNSEKLVVARPKCLETCTGIVLPVIDCQRNYTAEVVGTPVILRNYNARVRLADIAADVVGTIEVIEGRDREHSSRSDGVQLGKIDQVILLVFDITYTQGFLAG